MTDRVVQCRSDVRKTEAHSSKSFRHTGSGLLVCRTTAGAAVKLFKVEEMKESRPAASSRGLEKATSVFISDVKSLVSLVYHIYETVICVRVRVQYAMCKAIFQAHTVMLKPRPVARAISFLRQRSRRAREVNVEAAKVCA